VSRISKFACAILAVFYFGNPTGPHVAHAQESPKTLKDQLVGSWRLVSINNLRADGTKYELFGPDAKGIVIFDRNGTYSFQIMRAARPAFVAESRMEARRRKTKRLCRE
jgi:hypothetical protein